MVIAVRKEALNRFDLLAGSWFLRHGQLFSSNFDVRGDIDCG